VSKGAATGYNLFYHEAGRWQLNIGGSTSVCSVYSNGLVVPPGTWTHLAAGYDSETNTINLWVNGIKSSSSCNSGYFSTGLNLLINSGGIGTVDDVLIFNRTLADVEVWGLYANQSSTYLGVNFTNLLEGNYTFRAYSQDLYGKVGSTEERRVEVDLPVPPGYVAYYRLEAGGQDETGNHVIGNFKNGDNMYWDSGTYDVTSSQTLY